MTRISGPTLAQQILNKLKTQPTPSKPLAAVLVGNDHASVSFINQKKKVAAELGINFRIVNLPQNTDQETLQQEIRNLAQDNSIGGILIQLPLPENLDTQTILDEIPVGKDLDVLATTSVQQFELGKSVVLPPSVETVEEILCNQNFDLNGKTVAVVGIGRLVGQPISTWLENRVGKLIKIDINDDLNQIQDADLIISGTGQPRLIKPEMLKHSAAVIDFGYGKVGEQTSGDLNTTDEKSLEKLSFYTPAPGGTGPILVAKLLENFYTLNL